MKRLGWFLLCLVLCFCGWRLGVSAVTVIHGAVAFLPAVDAVIFCVCAGFSFVGAMYSFLKAFFIPV